MYPIVIPGRVPYSSLVLWVLSMTDVMAQKDGMCVDRRPDCFSLASDGYCKSNFKEMFEACPRACRFCNENTSHIHNIPNINPNEVSCFDRHINCKSWARHGVCRSHPQDMEQMCAESCNFCTHIPKVKKSIANPDFDCGRPYPTRSTRRARQVPRPVQIGETTDSQGFGDPTESPLRNLKVEDTVCGATVISSRYLVTAAHCVLDPKRPVRMVRLGELDFSRQDEENSKPADYEIEKIIVHPHYNPNLLERYNDIALLQTVVPIEFNEFVYPMCVTNTSPPVSTPVTGSGFGKVNSTSHSSILQQAELRILSASECESAYRENSLEPVLRGWYPVLLQGRDSLCAGYPRRGACKGDAGGPLYHDASNGRRYLVGISSLGVACKGTKYADLPGIYVDVADHTDFIDSVLYGF